MATASIQTFVMPRHPTPDEIFAGRLAVLGLASGPTPSKVEIDRAFHKKGKPCHERNNPSGNQRLQREWNRVYWAWVGLRGELYPEAKSDCGDHGFESMYAVNTMRLPFDDPFDPEEDYDGWSEYLHPMPVGYDDSGSEYLYDYLPDRIKELAVARRGGGPDYRDAPVGGGAASAGSAPACTFCRKSAPIDEPAALRQGLAWQEYTSHPRVADGTMATCWGCKTAHKSAMTESQALKGFAKKLDAEFIATLRHTFSHKPVHGGPFSRTSVYYWVPDLEAEAQLRGWTKRTPKNKSAKSPGAPRKKAKREEEARPGPNYF